MTRRFQPTEIAFAITVHKGRDRTVRVTITNDTVGDITNAKLWFVVKKDIHVDTDLEALITKKSANNGGADAQAKVVDGANRIVEFYIVPADTASMGEGDYWGGAAIELPGGAKVQLVPPFRFTVIQPVAITL
jgi:hypothetical protein